MRPFIPRTEQDRRVSSRDQPVAISAAPLMPRLAADRAWYTPLRVLGAVALLIAVYALLWVVVAQGSG
jgi:hypothetical protein